MGSRALLLLLLTLAASPAAGQTTLIPAGAVWKYLDDGSDQGTAWRENGFDDGAWAAGPAQFGYGDGDETTVVSYGPNSSAKYVTTYFRNEFSIPDPSAYAILRLRLLRDDGAVVYLNGAEVYRTNLRGGTMTYMRLATEPVSGEGEDRFFEWPVPASLVVAGTNVLAVEIHQASPSSSDISFDCELAGFAEATHPVWKGPRLVFTGSASEMKLVWQLSVTDTCRIEWGEDTSYGMGSAETYEYGDHQHAHTISGLAAGAKYFYRVVVAADTLAGDFWAAPPADATRVKFMVYGDTRTYPDVHDQVAGAMVDTFLADEEFQTVILDVGDLIEDGDSEDCWQYQFFDPLRANIQTMLASAPLQSCMGNHEESGVLFQKYFPYSYVSDRYYSFDYGPAHFVIVDQYVDYSPGSPQLIWIENDLATTTKLWRIVILHEPGYSAGGHGNDADVQNYIQPLCVQYGVKFVFAGHNHYYARAVSNKVQHITTGGGGAPLYAPNPGYPGVQAVAEAHHFCKMEIDGIWATLTVVEPDGTVIEILTKGTPVLVGAPQVATTPGALALRPATPNPFRSSTAISFSLPSACVVRLGIFDSGGRRVADLADEWRRAGQFTELWNGRNSAGRAVGPGVYFVRLVAADEELTEKVVLLE